MSILKDPYVAPSRVKGVVRYLLAAKGQREKRDTLEALLSPVALIGKGEDKQISRNMVQSTIRECIKIGLMEESEDGSEVAINPQLYVEESSLPSVLSQLLLNTPDNSENHDLARVLAWYLAQDFFEAPGNWPEAQQRLRNQVGGDLLELNDTRFGQFEDWSRYLGFTWHNCYLIRKDEKTKTESVLLPDPTAYLKQNLGKLFEGSRDQSVSAGEFIHRLGKYCPIFETGSFREDVEDQIGGREPNYFSTVTSIALRRLEEEKLIKLEKPGDAKVWVLQDGTDSRVSQITWINESSPGEKV